MPQEMREISPAAVARGADQCGRHLHLVKRLVPDLVEAIGRRHPRPDAGIHEVEEEQAGDSLRCAPRQRLHDRAADIVADHAGLIDTKHIQ